MKYETTFEELGKIFSTIAKAEKKVEGYKDARKAYTKASQEYCEHDYDAFYAIRQSDAYDVAEKARKAVKKVFSELLCLLDIDGCCTGGEEGYIVELSKRLYEPLSFLTAITEQAVRLAKSVTTY